ncbi:MAG TPA: glycoside hydrolase family 3 N-terminal domain-containing protein [Fibrobacteraceae bacterium]|nr:glycoside hydrolase family 3 N-terminal domain-containing protein [Fibrobacteraceae bacterium]
MAVQHCFLGIALSISLASATAIHLSGTVVDESGVPIEVAVAGLMVDGQVLPRLYTQSDSSGAFQLDSSDGGVAGILPGNTIRYRSGALAWYAREAASVQVEALTIQGRVVSSQRLDAGVGTQEVLGFQGLLANQSAGVYLLQVRQGNTILAISQVVNTGDASGNLRLVSAGASSAISVLAKSATGFSLVVHKAGYTPDTLDISNTETDLGNITLTRDSLEDTIDSILALMSTAQKIGQMTQAIIGNISSSDIGTYSLGSVLSGGDEDIGDYNALQTVAMKQSPAIPIVYGVDAVHGNNKVEGAVISPHNIALGATRDTNLVRRMAEVTAKEVRASGVDYTFAPCIAVVRDERWGRTYESFGETPELAVMMADAFIRGLQGDRFDADWRVLGTAKHYLADGGTEYGTSTAGWEGAWGLLDEGDAQIDSAEVRSIHLPGYIAAVNANVLSIMASYSSINGVKNHGNYGWLTTVLKDELGFEGFIISDYNAIIQINSSSYSNSVKQAINAGIDMAMEAGGDGYYDHADFISTLESLVAKDSVPISRINDAVRRILRSKLRAGRFAHPMSDSTYLDSLGSDAHREVAREAVRKSLVVLKNDNSTLPLSKTGSKIAVFGSHADDAGLQCGGWTLSWQGFSGDISGVTTILSGMQSAVSSSTVVSSSQYSLPSDADDLVLVIGEDPYAEYLGDSAASDLTLTSSQLSAISTASATGIPLTVVLVTGRPRIIPDSTLSQIDALVEAWLPGSEGEGVADILFGDYSPSGTLPISWPKNTSQVPIHFGDNDYNPLYEYGYGLTW